MRLPAKAARKTAGFVVRHKGSPHAAIPAITATSRQFAARYGLRVERFVILEKAWEALPFIGRALRRHWSLEAVQKDKVIVKVSSAPARHELLLHKTQIIRELNKHFESPWIRDIQFYKEETFA